MISARFKQILGRRVYKFVWAVLRRREMSSRLLRLSLMKFHGVSVGMYSYGCFDPKRIGRGTSIGRYCSFASTSYRFNGNHGLQFLSLHPYLYNIRLGMVNKEMIVRSHCVIEDDVWLGHAALILPKVKLIGRGSVIAAGAVVTKDVPKYAIVAGNPAKVIKYRFDAATIERIENTRWWLKSKDEIAMMINENPELLYRPQVALGDVS